jgi:hypothetical protein
MRVVNFSKDSKLQIFKISELKSLLEMNSKKENTGDLHGGIYEFKRG